MTYARPRIVGTFFAMTGVAVALTGCPPPQTGAQMQRLVNAGVDTIQSDSERKERLRKQKARHEKLRNEAKTAQTLAEARQQAKLAAEEFQVRAGGESGGGGGDGH